jgi:hypothetical protein
MLVVVYAGPVWLGDGAHIALGEICATHARRNRLTPKYGMHYA